MDTGVFNCTMFSSIFNVDMTDVVALNPWVGEDCEGVWDFLSSDGYEQICVESKSPSPSPSTSSTSRSSVSATTTSTATGQPAISQLPECGVSFPT